MFLLSPWHLSKRGSRGAVLDASGPERKRSLCTHSSSMRSDKVGRLRRLFCSVSRAANAICGAPKQDASARMLMQRTVQVCSAIPVARICDAPAAAIV